MAIAFVSFLSETKNPGVHLLAACLGRCLRDDDEAGHRRLSN